jgi:hypothetical protein
VEKVILAHAVMHEVGHLVLGDKHLASGLMRARWELSDYRQMLQGGLRFTTDEAVRFRSVVAERSEAVL